MAILKVTIHEVLRTVSDVLSTMEVVAVTIIAIVVAIIFEGLPRVDSSEATGGQVVRNQNWRGNGRAASMSTLLFHGDSPEQARGAVKGRLTRAGTLDPWNRSSHRVGAPGSTPALAVWWAQCVLQR